jgi:hypothetical protein
MAKQTEQQVRRKCILYAKERGWVHIRLHFGPGAARGWPDDLFLGFNRKPVFVEFKGPKGVVSPLQWQRIMLLQDIGMYADVVRSFREFVVLLEGIPEA